MKGKQLARCVLTAGFPVDEMIALNRKAWQHSADEYQRFCKAYFVNYLLSCRLLKLVKERNALATQQNSGAKVPSSGAYYLDHSLKVSPQTKLYLCLNRAQKLELDTAK